MSRFDARRSAATPEELPGQLHLQWIREYPPLKPAWPDQPKMPFDIASEPIVTGQTLFLGSSRTDSVTALDTRTGNERWRFWTDGPVRFAPVAWEGHVYFASDDGYLYCVDAANGKLVWKFRGGPADRRILGNERLISTWPARGAPVIVEGTVYFAASIWPFMGIFIHALDARTGQVIWTNDGDGSIYMKQPHNADSFASVAPQGPLVVLGDYLLIPGGRSIPALYHRKTGKLVRYQLAENAKRGGGSQVSAVGNLFFNGGAIFDVATEKHVGLLAEPVVLTDDVVHGFTSGTCRALDLKNARTATVETKDRKGELVKVIKWNAPELGSAKLAGVQAMIQAGTRLFAGAPEQVMALDLPLPQSNGAPSWQANIDGTPVHLAAADGRLFVSTREGRLYCFGADRTTPVTHRLPAPAQPVTDAWTSRAQAIVEQVREGYCVAWGTGSGRLVAELACRSKLHIIVVEPDARKVQTLRAQLLAEGLYGERVVVHEGHPRSFPLPPYLAGLMVSEDLTAAGIELDRPFLQKAFQSLRPFGGLACLPVPAEKRAELARRIAEAGLERARVRESNGQVLLSRDGPLPGTANWTHEHADAANTRVSRDQLVKAPLGLLWFGGPSNEGILPRHGHGPQPQVIDGRLIIEGIHMLRAMDIYTGRVLWETRLPGVGDFYNNLAHQPGANASGTNYISTSAGIYVVHGSSCLRLDPATGQKMGTFRLPPVNGSQTPPRWGYINVCDDYLVGGADPVYDPKLVKFVTKPSEGDDKPETTPKPASTSTSKPSGSSGSSNDNLSSSRHLVVMDRHTGKVHWSVTARSGFRHNGICIGGGRLYCIDRLSGAEIARMKRRGEEPKTKARLLALDLATGKELWSTETDVFGTWLSYAANQDILVEAGRVAKDTLGDEPKGMRAYDAARGTVLWHQPTHVGPAMLHGDTILAGQKACDLRTGKPRMRLDPLTAQPVEWSWVRNYGCNTPAASEHLLTFRSGAAGYFDLCNDGGTGNFGGFRSSCTNNLIVAGGLLTVPDYTRTCTCSYQNQTSLALIHMPEVEMWTSFGTLETKAPIRRVGINLGAPGDRKAADGTLWLEYPSVGGQSPVVPVSITGKDPEFFRRHASQVAAGEYSWVAASGVKGATGVTLALAKEVGAERTYTVRLHFLEPEQLKPGQRVFSIALQGQAVLSDLDIVRETGGAQRALVKEFKNIRVKKDLTLSLVPARNSENLPVLSGIEIIAEGW